MCKNRAKRVQEVFVMHLDRRSFIRSASLAVPAIVVASSAFAAPAKARNIVVKLDYGCSICMGWWSRNESKIRAT
jgi:hypothetical protein